MSPERRARIDAKPERLSAEIEAERFSNTATTPPFEMAKLRPVSLRKATARERSIYERARQKHVG